MLVIVGVSYVSIRSIICVCHAVYVHTRVFVYVHTLFAGGDCVAVVVFMGLKTISHKFGYCLYFVVVNWDEA